MGVNNNLFFEFFEQLWARRVPPSNFQLLVFVKLPRQSFVAEEPTALRRLAIRNLSQLLRAAKVLALLQEEHGERADLGHPSARDAMTVRHVCEQVHVAVEVLLKILSSRENGIGTHNMLDCGNDFRDVAPLAGLKHRGQELALNHLQE